MRRCDRNPCSQCALSKDLVSKRHVCNSDDASMGKNESVNECVEIATREMKIAGFTKYIDSSINKDNKKQATINADHSKRPATTSARALTPS